MYNTLILIIILNAKLITTQYNCDIFINPEALSNRPRPHFLILGYRY